MKKAANPIHMKTTTASKVKTPMFIPCASDESDRPKQAEQACALSASSALAAKSGAAKTRIDRGRFTDN